MEKHTVFEEMKFLIDDIERYHGLKGMLEWGQVKDMYLEKVEDLQTLIDVNL